MRAEIKVVHAGAMILVLSLMGMVSLNVINLISIDDMVGLMETLEISKRVLQLYGMRRLSILAAVSI